MAHDAKRLAVVTGASSGIGYELARCCVVRGWHNKLQSAIANVTPASVLANMHRRQAAPGSGDAR